MSKCKELKRLEHENEKLRKKVESLNVVLRVVYTWATFEEGSLLLPEQVAQLIGRELGKGK